MDGWYSTSWYTEDRLNLKSRRGRLWDRRDQEGFASRGH